MDPFVIENNEIILEPLQEDNILEFYPHISKEEIQKHSLLHYDFNISTSTDAINRRISQQEKISNKLFLIKQKKTNDITGLTGIIDIDMIQQRGTIVLLMEETHLMTKKSYGPLKILLIHAFKKWSIRKLLIPVFESDNTTQTVLKGFGFTIEGTIAEYIQWKDELYDIVLLGLLKKDFRYVEI